MQDKPESKARSLYETDFVVWCDEQARLVRARRFDDLDIENMAEGLESMGRSDKRQIESRLEILISHPLKWKYQPGGRNPGWSSTIAERRPRIARLIDESPSLKGYPASMAIDLHAAARLEASKETGIDFTLFPEECAFAAAQILDGAFLPKEPDLYDQS